jgi:tetratricopeptide (TPR) repeat protein
MIAMSQTVRSALAGAVSLALALPVLAQPTGADRPAKHVPVKPLTKQELDRREAVTLYGVGVLQERANKLAEAARTLEKARRLDPDSAPIHKALVPIYLALDRVDDALATCRRAFDLSPDDHEIGYLYARQLRSLDRRKEAINVLRRTLRCNGLKDRPDLAAQMWFDFAALNEQVSNWKESEKAFRKVAALLEKPATLIELGAYTKEEIAAQTAETYERLGRVCLKAGAPDRAIAAFQEAQKKDPIRAPRLALNLAQVYEEQGKFREALARIDEYLRTQPQGMEAYEARIKLQRKLGRQADIVPDLQTSSGRDPNNVSLKLLLAREYRKAGKKKDALGTYDDILRTSDAPEVYRGLFELYKEEGRAGGEKVLLRLDAAIAAAGKDKKPGSPVEAANARSMLVVLREDADLVKLVLPAAARLRARPPLAYATKVILATLAARTKQLDSAEELYRSALNQAGGPAQSEADVYGGLLRVLKYRYKHQAVVALCKQGLAKAQATNRVLFHLEMARAQLALDNTKEALAAAEAAVNDAGEGQRLLTRLVKVQMLSACGEHAKAEAECRELLKVYNQGGDLRDVRVELSNVHQAAGQHDKSEEQLEMLLRSDPNDATVNNNLGYQWAERNKNLAEAEKLIRKALDLDRKQRTSGTALGPDSDKDNAAYVDSLGWVLFRQGKLDDARRELERATELPGGDDDPVVWDHLGDVYFRLKDRARAATAWRKAVALFEAGARRRSDPRKKEIQDKLRLVKP